MYGYTSIETMKSVVLRCLPHLIYRNTRPKFSHWHLAKSIGSLSPNYNSPKRLLTLTCMHKMHNHRSLTYLFDSSRRAFPSIVPQCAYQTKPKDFKKEDNDNSEMVNKPKNVLDDLEFEVILKDFARDFEVNDETRKFLEQIKQSQNGFDDETVKPPVSKTMCSSYQLEFKKDTESRTSSLPFSDMDTSELLHDHNLHAAQHFENTRDHSSVGEEYFHIDQELEKSTEYVAQRGKTGVYDIDDLVTVLKEENLLDICVIQVPESFHYVDYMVLATAKSPRHSDFVMELIMKLYKKKKSKSDPYLTCVGKKVASWKMFDMGNIRLDIFLEDTRNFYDLEPLWLLDRKYDSVSSVKSDPQIDMMQHQLDFLNTLNPK